MKKAIALVLLVSIAFFAVVYITFNISHNSIKASNNVSDDKIELTFMNSWGGYDSKAGTLEELLDKYEKANSSVTVTNQSMYGDDFLPTIKEKFAAGDEPDVFGLWPGSDIRGLIRAGKVADLTKLLNTDKKWKNSFSPDMWSEVTDKGKTYGIPVEITFEGLFINRDLFDKYKVPVPHNYNQLLSAIDIFNKNKIIPIAFNCSPEGSYLYQEMAVSLGGKMIENPINNGVVDQSYITALYKLRELYKDKKAFPSDCFFIQSNERNNLFLNKKAAMIAQGSWFLSQCTSSKVEIIPFPQMTDSVNKPVIYGLGCGTFYISQKAWNNPKKRNEAIKLLKYITSEQSSKLLAEKTGMLSNVNMSGSINYDTLTQQGLDMIKSTDLLVGPPDSYMTRSVWDNVVVENMPDVLSGSKSPEELWDRAIAAGAEEK